MYFKKSLVIVILGISMMLYSSCNKQNSSSSNVTLQESSNIISTDEKKETKEDDTIKAEQLNPDLQQIIDKNEFLNSFEGTQYQINAYYFVRAFLNGDYTYIQEKLIDKSSLDEYDYKDTFSNVECMYFRLLAYNKQEQIVHGECAIQLSKDSGYIYLEFNMKLIEGTWKIVNYQLDA